MKLDSPDDCHSYSPAGILCACKRLWGHIDSVDVFVRQSKSHAAVIPFLFVHGRDAGECESIGRVMSVSSGLRGRTYVDMVHSAEVDGFMYSLVLVRGSE